MTFAYLGALLVAPGGHGRARLAVPAVLLALAACARPSCWSSGVVFFLVWDLVGIGLGIFFRGETAFMTGILLAPELPLEELFFLTLLCYLTMNLVRLAVRADARGEAVAP